MKTTKEWLNEWEHEAKEAALKNCEDEGTLNDMQPSLSWAIVRGFDWQLTIEGNNYWEAIVKYLDKNGK